MGYRDAVVCTADHLFVFAFRVTPANVSDKVQLIPTLGPLEAEGMLKYVGALWGDNAFCTTGNREWMVDKHVADHLHTADETGKDRKNPRSARRKSKIRSKIEALFGILRENTVFQRSRVRTLPRVTMEQALIFTAHNLFGLVALIDGRFEDHLSMRRFLWTLK